VKSVHGEFAVIAADGNDRILPVFAVADAQIRDDADELVTGLGFQAGANSRSSCSCRLVIDNPFWRLRAVVWTRTGIRVFSFLEKVCAEQRQ